LRQTIQASANATGTALMASTGMATNMNAPPSHAQGLTLRQASGKTTGHMLEPAARRLKNITHPDTSENRMPAPKTKSST
jgi:hypothetical protein